MQGFTTNFTNFDSEFLQRINIKEYPTTKQNKQFKFKGKHLFALLLIAIGIWIGFKIFLPSDPDFTVEAAKELAQKIYEAGKVGESLKDLPLDAELKKKLTEEIGRILAKPTDYDSCEVYLLDVLIEGYYPILGYGDEIIGYEYMYVDDTWKVGMTGNEEKGRYPTGVFYKSVKNNYLLTKDQLKYNQIFVGTYKHCLILERILIYTYPLWSGHPNLIKPPGCKIFR